MRQRVYYWVHHTGRYDGNTGLQRVVRALGGAVAAMDMVDLVPVRWCAEREAIVRASTIWREGLAKFSGPALPGVADADLPLHLAPADAGHLSGAWLLLPEVPHVGGGVADAPAPAVPVALDYARFYGLRTAVIFYDLVPLRVAGYADMAAAHAAYAFAIAAADLVLPISVAASVDLQAWWREQGFDPDRFPTTRPVPLPAEMVGVKRCTAAMMPPETGVHAATPIRILTVGTVEPRKNQLALLRAVNRLHRRRPDLAVSIDVVGNLHGGVAMAVQKEVAEGQGRIRLHRYLHDDAVRALMRDCDATAFISLAEGYGLPIVESLWQGKPCLCSDIGSMAEIAAGGGCLCVDPTDPFAIEEGLERLAAEPALRDRLAQEARSRPLANWEDYAVSIMAELTAVPKLQRLAVIEGTKSGGAELAGAFRAMSVQIRDLHWRADAQAILPGFRHAEEPVGGRCSVDLRGVWAVLPLASTAGAAETMRIESEARGLGLKLAITVAPGRILNVHDVKALAGADLALFATEADREEALALSFRSLPRIATLRHRFRAAAGARPVLDALASEQPRIAAIGRAPPPTRVFFYAGLTASQPFNTGVQRVTRALGRSLGERGVDLIPVKWDALTERLVALDADEARALARWDGPPPRDPAPLPPDLAGEWLMVPEITVPVWPAGSNICRYARSLGMRTAAIFYDLIPLKMSHIFPPGMLPAFTEYWEIFGDVDLSLPISWTVAAELRRYLDERGHGNRTIVVCPLAGNIPGSTRSRATPEPHAADAPLRLIAVGTREVRKNYPRLIRAVGAARQLVPHREIVFTVVGRRADLPDLDAEMDALAKQEGGIHLAEHLPDADLLALLERSDATLFGSWEEGFGLPVLESLWNGLPCICHDGSAMAEVAPGGGTIAVDMLDEQAIAHAIARLADEDGLLDRLRREAVARPIKTWDDYAADVLAAMAQAASVPGWPLPAILTGGARPKLSCAITTYNRAHWLTHSLPRLIEAARPFGRDVEVLVCDNTSTDATPEVVARFAGTPGFVSRRNPQNIGMLGNLGATARACSGEFVWLIGDDDLVLDGAIEAVMQGLTTHPDVETAYLNYAYTSFDSPEQLRDPGDIVRTAHSIGFGGGPNRRVAALREVAALNENLFTAIYACVFRRDHALRAYQQDISGPPFSSLLTCIPSSVYALAALQDRPAWWVAQPAIVVNMNVSWLRWVLLWHIERMPDLFDAAELAGIDPVRVDRHRAKHCWNAAEWVRSAFTEAEDPVRHGISVARLIERCKHIEVFTPELAKLRTVYEAAWTANKTVADTLAPATLFERYGLA